jgi:hypothetical protein
VRTPGSSRSVTEGVAGGPRRSQRVGGACECDEERVTLRVDLDTAMPLKRVPQQPAMVGEGRCVVRAELVQQPGGSLDVGEQEGDGALGSLVTP